MSNQTKPCEYCGTVLPFGVDKGTRRIRSYHFQGCAMRPVREPLKPITAEDRLRDACETALSVLEDLDESEMARLRGRADQAIAELKEALA